MSAAVATISKSSIEPFGYLPVSGVNRRRYIIISMTKTTPQTNASDQLEALGILSELNVSAALVCSNAMLAPQ